MTLISTNRVEKFVIGIDPGASGGMAIIPLRGMEDMQVVDYQEGLMGAILEDWYRSYPVVYCYLERQQAMRMTGAGTKPGITSTFNHGRGYGQWEGRIEMTPFPVKRIEPQKWMRQLGIPAKLELKARKKAIAVRMLEMYPKAELYGPRGGLRDGRSDALAIAHRCKLDYNEGKL